MSGQPAGVATGAGAPAPGAGGPSLAHLPVTSFSALQRVLVHDAALPGTLLPSISILIAPPAVAMLSWAALTGDAGGPVARVLWRRRSRWRGHGPRWRTTLSPYSC
jgi:hypothetical protein